MAWETFPYSYTSPWNHSWIFETLRAIIFWVRVTHKMLNLNWEKIHSIILSVTCHGLRNFPPTHTHPLISIREFLKILQVIFWVRVTHKMLNLNWGKNSLNNFFCHLSWLEKHIPLKPFVNFAWNPMSYYFLSEFSKPYELLFFESLIKCWMWIT